MKKYSTKKVDGGVALLMEGEICYITDAKTARRDARLFNEAAQQSQADVCPDCKWVGGQHYRYCIGKPLTHTVSP